MLYTVAQIMNHIMMHACKRSRAYDIGRIQWHTQRTARRLALSVPSYSDVICIFGGATANCGHGAGDVHMGTSSACDFL